MHCLSVERAIKLLSLNDCFPYLLETPVRMPDLAKPFSLSRDQCIQ